MESRYDYVLVGGGVTSVGAAQNIREADSQGTIALFGEETHPPYDRPPLSKGMIRRDDVTPDDAYSKYDDFYPKNNIDLHKGVKVTGIDRAGKTITLADGTKVGYGKLLLATGARPRRLEVPGIARPNVFFLRRIEDALTIREAATQGKRAVLIGTGYIGMEVSADLRARGLDVTLVSRDSYPWATFASPKFGEFYKAYYEKQGVRFALNEEIASIEGDAPLTVVTKTGKKFPADLVVVGVGAELNTELAQQAGLEMGSHGGVKVNEFLQTSDPSIWAAGDIAVFPDVTSGATGNAEHHLNAKWQGQAVGKIMAGEQEPYQRVPYFFAEGFDIYMTLRGNARGGKNSVFAGDVAGGDFVELYYDDAGLVTTGIAVAHEESKTDAVADTLETLLLAKVNIRGREAEIASPGFDIASLA